jgi:transcriptional regulator CtsR
MASLSDKIGRYLKQLLTEKKAVKIQRSKLARKFDCVPSQINYVLDTRFTQDKGYIVKSQRGGSGYIKIIKIEITSEEEIINRLSKRIGNKIDQQRAYNIIDRLWEQEIIDSFQKTLFKSVLDRQTLRLTPQIRDRIRARLLKSILESLLRKEE